MFRAMVVSILCILLVVVVFLIIRNPNLGPNNKGYGMRSFEHNTIYIGQTLHNVYVKQSIPSDVISREVIQEEDQYIEKLINATIRGLWSKECSIKFIYSKKTGLKVLSWSDLIDISTDCQQDHLEIDLNEPIDILLSELPQYRSVITNNGMNINPNGIMIIDAPNKLNIYSNSEPNVKAFICNEYVGLLAGKIML